jgi:hypothetical protein
MQVAKYIIKLLQLFVYVLKIAFAIHFDLLSDSRLSLKPFILLRYTCCDLLRSWLFQLRLKLQ